MKPPIVIIGIGELAGVYAKGFLRCGYPVYPITREMDLNQQSQTIPQPEMVLVAVQENELQALLQHIPENWRDKLSLIQNELLPKDWLQHDLQNPTVTVVWFEKKPHMEVNNILYSPSYGPQAELMSQTLKKLNIPAPILTDKDALLYELLRKSLYILTVNIAGLVENWTVEELWLNQQQLAREIALEVIQLQTIMINRPLDQEKLIQGMVEGIKDCPNRHCLGRRAIQRLERAIEFARSKQIATPKMDEIYFASASHKSSF